MDPRVPLHALLVVFAAAFLVFGAATALANSDNAGNSWGDSAGHQAGWGPRADTGSWCEDTDSGEDQSGDSWDGSPESCCNGGDDDSTDSSARNASDGDDDDCATPAIATAASSATVGQPIHDVATVTGGNAPTGTITWNVYAAGATCTTALKTVTVAVNGDGTYTSPDFTPQTAGSYQWVAGYSGDSQNRSVSGKCNDPAEQSSVSQAAPSIASTATSSMLGQAIHDVATLTGGDAPTGTITWNVYAPGTGCAKSLHTETANVSGDGVYISPDFIPPASGSYEWVASYGGDANNTSAGSSCSDPNEQSTFQTAPARGVPAIVLVDFESAGASGSLTHGPLQAPQGATIYYQMSVINTGNVPLAITFTDPHCDAGTLTPPTLLEGTFDPATSTLSAGGALRYTCTHVLLAGGPPQFTDAASVSGQPPSGPPVTASDSVVALVGPPKQSLQGVTVVRCGAGKVKTTKRRHGKAVVVCAPKKTKKKHSKPHHQYRHSQPVVIRRTDRPSLAEAGGRAS